MKKIVLNYDYSIYPYTTASYLEMALKRLEGIKCFHEGEINSNEVDLVINVQPVPSLVVYKGVPSCYWEIDNHLSRGEKKAYYAKVDKVYIAQEPFLHYYPKGKTTYLPLACDPSCHHRVLGVSQSFDIGFAGNDTYPARRQLLDILQANFNLLRTNTKPGLPFSEALSQCSLTFNRSMYLDMNMRFFEAIAIGRLLLTDYLKAQDGICEEGRHYIAYENSKDLIEKVKYFLDHEKEREKIAFEGALYIRKYHTYDARLKTILRDFSIISK